MVTVVPSAKVVRSLPVLPNKKLVIGQMIEKPKPRLSMILVMKVDSRRCVENSALSLLVRPIISKKQTTTITGVYIG